MVKYCFIALVFLPLFFSTFSCEGQNKANISGYIKGLGSGKKVYLGNKPSGYGAGFIEQFYDSTFSFNDSFRLKPVFYKTVSDYSIEAEGVKGGLSFLIDTGHIRINGQAEKLYRSEVTGSGNQDVTERFYRELYRPWNQTTESFKLRAATARKTDSVLAQKITDSMVAATAAYRQHIYQFYLENVKAKPVAAFRALSMSTLSLLPDTTLRRYFNLLPKSVQQSPELERIAYRLNGFEANIRPGKQLPGFSFINPGDSTIKLTNVRAKYKLVVFWASWCAPCIEEIPVLDSLYQKYRQKGLKIIAVNVDNNPLLWKNNLYRYTFDCVHLYQGGFSTAPMYKYFNISAIPFMVLLNADNKILKYNIRLPEIDFYIK